MEKTLTKAQVIELIKSVDIKEAYASEDEKKRKWFRFGAYDALRTLTEMVKEYEEKPKEKASILK